MSFHDSQDRLGGFQPLSFGGSLDSNSGILDRFNFGAAAGPAGFDLDKLLGFGKLGLGGFNAFLGLQGLNEAKRQNKFNEGIATENLEANKKLTNERLQTRDFARRGRGIDSGNSRAEFLSKFTV